jgi:Villin headpiece domain
LLAHRRAPFVLVLIAALLMQDVIELAQLRQMKGSDGIDPANKEDYLSPEVFMELFKMDLDAFKALPLWRRQNKKKEMELF